MPYCVKCNTRTLVCGRERYCFDCCTCDKSRKLDAESNMGKRMSGMLIAAFASVADQRQMAELFLIMETHASGAALEKISKEFCDILTEEQQNTAMAGVQETLEGMGSDGV